MPDPTLSARASRLRVRRARPAGLGAASAGFAALVVALVALAAAAAHALVPHALEPVAHKVLAAQPLSGLAALVFALGAPLEWRVSAAGNAGDHVTGTLRAGALVHGHPLVLAGPVLVGVAVCLAGFFASRHAVRIGRSAGHAAMGSAAGFTVLCTVAALAVSRANVVLGAGLTARVHVDLATTFVLGAAWGGIGAAAGWALAARRLPSLTETIASWRLRLVAPASGLLVSGVLLAALLSPGTGLVAAASAGPTTTSSAPSTTVTTAAPDTSTTAATTPTSGAGPTTTAKPRSATSRSTTSTTGRSTAAATTSAAAAKSHTSALSFDPPAPGTYTYTTSGSASWGLGKTVFPSSSTLVVDPAVGNRQHSRRSVLTVAGEGFVLDQWLEYWPSGIRVSTQRITTTFNKSTTVRDLRASATQLYLSPTPAPGEHHEFDLASPLVAAHEVVDVLRTETITIAGQPVNAAVVRTVLHLSGDASGTLQFDQWFDMSRRIVVKETNTATVKASVVTLTSNYSATLQRLTPS